MNDTRGGHKEAQKASKENGAIADQETRCRLCLKPAHLCDSHIVSEFFYDQLYDEIHRCYSLSSIQGKPIRLLQKGVREELLCRSCERQFSVYEQHARSVLYGGVEIGVEELGKSIRVEGIDYWRFKLFLMSLLWRLGETSLPYFKGVDLGAKHLEKLRQMLLAENPGEPWEYRCAITGLLHEGRALTDLISPPAWGKVGGHRVYTMAIGGFVFAFFVSSHKPYFIMDGFLQKNGQLLILRKEFTEIPFLMQLGSEITAATKGRQLPGT